MHDIENGTAAGGGARASKAELIGWTGFIDDAHVAAIELPPAPPTAAERKRGVKRQKGQGSATYFEKLATAAGWRWRSRTPARRLGRWSTTSTPPSSASAASR